MHFTRKIQLNKTVQSCNLYRKSYTLEVNMEKNARYSDPLYVRLGDACKYDKCFEDEQDFKINPTLLEQIKFSDCQETTPEGKALWLYVRLCQLLKYDEGYFFKNQRRHPNDDPYKSFEIVESVTAETPVTCFNFSRIAVKLLKEFAGVNALIVSVGDGLEHFRFGYYTDRVAVNAEPTTPHNHYNDLARIKLGIKPQGLIIIEGDKMMQSLQNRIVPPMLAESERELHEYIDLINTMDQKIIGAPQIKVNYLIDELKNQGIDGATTTQLMIDINHKFVQKPYRLSRMAINIDEGTKNKVIPQLLVREKQNSTLVDLYEMNTAQISNDDYKKMIHNNSLLYSDQTYATGNPECEVY